MGTAADADALHHVERQLGLLGRREGDRCALLRRMNGDRLHHAPVVARLPQSSVVGRVVGRVSYTGARHNGGAGERGLPLGHGVVKTTDPEHLAKLLSAETDLQREAAEEDPVHVCQRVYSLVHRLLHVL